MKKLILSFVVVAVFAVGAQTLHKNQNSLDIAFSSTKTQSLRDAVIPNPAGGGTQVVDPPPGMRLVHLSGRVDLSGSGFAPFGVASDLSLSGRAEVQDDSGDIRETVDVSCTQSFSGAFTAVSGTAYPSATVNIYKNDRLLGSVKVNGTIHVSGNILFGVAHLSGSGIIEGQGYIQVP